MALHDHRKNKTTQYARWAEKIFGGIERRLHIKNPLKFTSKRSLEAIFFLIIFVASSGFWPTA